MNNSYRIMVMSDPVFGSAGTSVVSSLRRLGHEVQSVNFRTIIPKVTTTCLKIVRRLLMGRFVRDYNQHLLSLQRKFQPEIFLAVKGSYILAETLRELRNRGVMTYNFYPDVSAFTHDKYIPKALPEYDHIFTTKSFHEQDFRQRLGIRNLTFVPHGYDPEVHRPLPLSDWDRQRYSTDVCFIGIHTEKKERLVSAVARSVPEAKIRIWGPLWRQRCRASELYPAIMNQPVEGWAYAKAIQASKICLGINSEAVPGSSSGDLMSMRSFEIPACGGLMMHERNTEVQSFYEDGKEVVTFESPAELVDQVRYYLDYADERQAIARAGYERAVPAYSYDERMRTCMEFYEKLARKAA